MVPGACSMRSQVSLLHRPDFSFIIKGHSFLRDESCAFRGTTPVGYLITHSAKSTGTLLAANRLTK